MPQTVQLLHVMSKMAQAAEQLPSWVNELETSLMEMCDFGTVRNICRGRPVPAHLRPEVWQICLNIQGRGDAMATFDGLYDMDEQTQLREDCTALVDKLGNEEDDRVSIVSDLESIFTFYSKSKNESYIPDNGWLEVIQPLLAMKYNRIELYNSFYTVVNRYLPKDCRKNGKPFHLFRLLLQYHDPELCSFLDTKRITPDAYAQQWFRSLFAGICDLEVIQNMWDVYFQHADPFLLFFLALVILVNGREQIITAENDSKQSIVELMSTFPAALEAVDIEDFCTLAQYYASRTPQSFRRDYQSPLFGTSLGTKEDESIQVSQALCLPVSVHELLQPRQAGVTDAVAYFIVDCRPAEQYNNGHLPTAFHLDANLMLQNPTEFNSAVVALFSTQKQAIAAGSVAGGEHLCFMGSGREEEDQYVHMVVANFLQKGHQYISVARGGYANLHEALRGNLSQGLTDHNPKNCIVCNPDMVSSASDLENGDDFALPSLGRVSKDSLLGKLSNVVKCKSAEMKEKLSNYIKNEQAIPERHVSSTDRLGKRYRNMASVFTIGDDEEDSSDEDQKEVVNVDTWLHKADINYSCLCKEVQDNGYMYPSYILVTDTHMFVLREIPQQKGMAYIQARRALHSILKITSKKKCPDFISFRYGFSNDSGYHVTDMDRFIISKATEATTHIKEAVLKVLAVQEG
ncbi:TBC1 domain family member 23 isoform X2 [Octopus sinensis]|uniref:TBC1 domain family member 23 n=1 Tax=Octopus sinensis TaxID=2607531 RepID=A0A6P7TC08_9MOLL|nr:TBC1 domain family member 23 isoform X2 [Octopus sinensis]